MSQDKLTFNRESERRTSDEKLRDQLDFIAIRALSGPRGRGWTYEIGPIEAQSLMGWTFSAWIRFYRTREVEAEKEARQREEIYEFAAAAGHHARFGNKPWTTAQLGKERKVEAPNEGITGPQDDDATVPLASISTIQQNGYFDHLYGLDAQIRVLLSSIQAAADSGMKNRFHSLLYGDPGCLAGSTFIPYVVKNRERQTQNSKGGTIENLYYRFNKIPRRGKGFYERSKTVDSEYFVVSSDSEGKIRLNKILTVINSGVRTVYRLITNTGRQILATSDHKFLTSGFEYVPLGGLSVGNEIAINPGKPKKTGRKPRVHRLEVLVKQHAAGRVKEVKGTHRMLNGEISHHSNTYCRISVHCAVYEAHQNGMGYREYVNYLNTCTEQQARELWSIPAGYEIHHKDENPYNNAINNLELKESASCHIKDHHLDECIDKITIRVEMERIVSIEKEGETQTYDISMQSPNNNFAANGFIVHNSGKTDILVSTSQLLSQMFISHLMIDATSTTEAGMRKALMDEDAILPEVIMVEEIEKAKHSFHLLLGLMDDRATVSQMNFRKTETRKVPALILASANDYELLKKTESGALLSRFSNEIYCPRPGREILAKILEREIRKVKGGREEWIQPTLEFCYDQRRITDPRMLKRVCLCGKDRLITGEYQRDLEETMKKVSGGSGSVDAFD